MKLKEDIRSVTYMKQKAAALLRKVERTRRPTVITQNGEAKAVVQDIKSYEEPRNTLLMLKLIAQSEEDIRRGRLIPQDEVFKRIRKDINRFRKNNA